MLSTMALGIGRAISFSLFQKEPDPAPEIKKRFFGINGPEFGVNGEDATFVQLRVKDELPFSHSGV